MKRLQQIISGYVALCLALAGAVGVSPVLHQWIEHGGHGPAHIHARGMAVVPVAVHSDDHEHSHDAGHVHPTHQAVEPSRPAGMFVHRHQPFKLPAFQSSRLWIALGHLFSREAQDPSQPSPDGPGHTHDSLAQSLASGLVEHTFGPSLLDCDPVLFSNRFVPAKVHRADSAWDAQTASRGPPSARS